MLISKSNFLTDEQLKKLLTPLSHDLKNHLTLISLHAQLLEKKLSGDVSISSVNKINKGVKNLEAHLNIFSEIIKLYYQESLVDLKPVQFANLHSELISLIPTAQLRIDEKVSISLTTDLNRLKRVLMSLISLLQSDNLEVGVTVIENFVKINISGQAKDSPPFPSEVILTSAQYTLDQMKSEFNAAQTGKVYQFQIHIPLNSDT